MTEKMTEQPNPLVNNPLVVVHRLVDQAGDSLGRGLLVWCPGCEKIHQITVKNEDGTVRGTFWEWNGKLDAGFSISPSLLAYSTVHLCEGEHAPEVCTNPGTNPGECGHTAHLILNTDWRETGAKVLGHPTPHTKDPAFGNCHSFIKDGKWQYLGDSAHGLKNQTVPMVPVPDWVVGKR